MPVDAGRTAAKWKRRASSAGEEYAQGVQNPSKPWAASAAAAAPLYAAGVQAAIGRNAFAKGVGAAGDAKWQQGATQKGPARFAEGVTLAEPAYAQGFARVAGVLNSVQYPPRQPTGSPGNIARVAAVATALRRLKTG